MGCSCTREPVIVSKRLNAKPDNEFNPSLREYQSTMINSVKINNTRTNVSLSRIDKQQDVFVIIISFLTEKRQINYPIFNLKEYIPFIDLMNQTIFSSNEFDCNFVSEFNKEMDEFTYKIERITFKRNKQHESRNKLWKVYINDNEESFSDLVNSGRVISKTDIVELEEFEVKKESDENDNNTARN